MFPPKIYVKPNSRVWYFEAWPLGGDLVVRVESL